MNTQQSQVDDLTKIKGIGRSRQQWFSQALAVRTYEQLAQLSADEVEGALRAAGKLPARSEIENWLTQARQLVSPQPLEGAAVAADASPDSRATMPEEGMDAAATAKKDEAWTPLASFVIEFQRPIDALDAPARRTAVHYIEVDKSAVWPGVALDQVHQWLADQVPLSPPEAKPHLTLETMVDTVPPATSVAAPATFRATKVRIIQTPHHLATIDVTRPLAATVIKHVSHEQPITIEVEMTVADAARPPFGANFHFTARCQVSDLTQGRQAYWLDMKESSATDDNPSLGNWSQRADLRLEPGVYALGVLLSGLQVTGPIYVELPKLNVL